MNRRRSRQIYNHGWRGNTTDEDRTRLRVDELELRLGRALDAARRGEDDSVHGSILRSGADLASQDGSTLNQTLTAINED